MNCSSIGSEKIIFYNERVLFTLAHETFAAQFLIQYFFLKSVNVNICTNFNFFLSLYELMHT